MIKRIMFALTAILLVACGGSLATTTPHPTSNPTVDPTEVTLSLTIEAIRAEPQETSEAIVNNARDATYEAEYLQNEDEYDTLVYNDLLVECVQGIDRRTPPLPKATATAIALTCPSRLLFYQSKFATKTAAASMARP